MDNDKPIINIAFINNKVRECKRERNLMLCGSSVLGSLTLIALFSGSNISLLSGGLGLTTLIFLEHYDKAREEYHKYEKELNKKRKTYTKREK